MKAVHSELITGTPEDFIQEVLHSNAIAGAHPFTYEDRHGKEFQILVFAVKCPFDLRLLCNMMHVMVESVDFYELWKGGRRPSDAEIAAMSPDE